MGALFSPSLADLWKAKAGSGEFLEVREDLGKKTYEDLCLFLTGCDIESPWTRFHSVLWPFYSTDSKFSSSLSCPRPVSLLCRHLSYGKEAAAERRGKGPRFQIGSFAVVILLQ